MAEETRDLETGADSSSQPTPDAQTGPLADQSDGASAEDLRRQELDAIMAERENYEPNPEIQEALQGIQDIPVQEALDET